MSARPVAMRLPACAVRQSGMSLVELMVGMLVGLIGIIIISHLYVTNEQYKRSTSGAGAAQVNGAVALYTLERDLRMAGYGINHTGALGCTCTAASCSAVQYYYDGDYSFPPTAGSKLRTLQIAPVVILSDGIKPDSITLLYGSGNERSTPSRLVNAMSPPHYEFASDGSAGFENNDMVVVAEEDKCALAQIMPVLNSNSQLTHKDTDSKYNPLDNGLLPIFSRDAFVYSLGANPVWTTYSIENNKLIATPVLPPTGGAGPQPLVDDIVDLKALYGKDTTAAAGGDRVVDTYEINPPTNADAWQRVLAIRVAVLARSQNYEKPDPVAGCKATTDANQPRWNKSKANPAGDKFPVLDTALALGPTASDAGCYKYRVFETVVPLRNMIWR